MLRHPFCINPASVPSREPLRRRLARAHPTSRALIHHTSGSNPKTEPREHVDREVKLSRVGVWHSRGQSTASIERGRQRFMISAGKSRIEWNSPTTPGSNRPGEERTPTVLQNFNSAYWSLGGPNAAPALKCISASPQSRTTTNLVLRWLQSEPPGVEGTNAMVSRKC